MSAETDIVEIPQKLRYKKAYRTKRNMCSRSNILKKIVDCLENGKCCHMLYWKDKAKKEFIIKFVHMNNEEFKKADYLELFKELDKLSNQYKNYLQDKKYKQNCKIRCKSNLRKLVESKALSFQGSKGNSIHFRTYKLNFVSETMSNGGNVNGLSGCETVQGITYINGMLKIENLRNEQSHCLCLSKTNLVSTAGSSLLDTCCTVENRNEDNRNVMLQNQPLSVNELEKQMDESDNTVNVMSVRDSTLCSSTSNEENYKLELMECSKLDEKALGNVKFQNNSALSESCAESLNIKSVEFPNCNYSVEEAMETGKSTDIQYASSGYNDLESSNNSPNRLPNETFQDMDDKSMIFAQVPSSPRNFYGTLNDLFYQPSEDYKSGVIKPLQEVKDPLWPSGISDCLNNNLPIENEYLMTFEDLF